MIVKGGAAFERKSSFFSVQRVEISAMWMLRFAGMIFADNLLYSEMMILYKESLLI